MKPFSTLSDNSRSNNFDFLRLFLAVTVIYSHSFLILYGTDHSDLMKTWTGRFGFSDIAVNFFFTISGFLITLSWMRSQVFWNFLQKRVLRIYPAFIVVTLFDVLIVGVLGADNLKAYLHSLNFTKVLLSALTLQGYPFSQVFGSHPTPNMVNGSLWTIQPEFICYFLVAGLGLVGALHRRWIVLLGFIFTLGLLVAQNSHIWHPSAGLVQWPRFLGAYFAGMTFYCYRDVIPFSSKVAIVSGLVVLLSVVLNKLMHLIFPVFGTYLLFFIAFDPRLKLQNVAKRGDISYGIYLYAFPVQQLLVKFFGFNVNFHLFFFSALAITTLLAIMSWHFVERPFLKLKPKSRIPAATVAPA